jgi:hypothetical protein
MSGDVTSTIGTRRRRLSGALRAIWVGAPGEPETGWLVRNETPWPIWIDGGARGAFVLAPLERRSERVDPSTRFSLDRLLDRHQLSIRRLEPERETTGELAMTLRGAAVGALLWLAGYLVLPRPLWLWLGIAFGLALAIVVFLLLTRPGRLSEARRVRRWTWQSLAMMTAVGIAVVGPALALWFGTNLYRSVDLGGPGLVHTDTPLELVGRLLQLTMIAVASLLPALMFFQFDAERLSTLRDRWMQNIFRLDPTLSTLSDVEAKYGRQIEEAYGSRGDGRGRLTRGRRSPLIVATVVITFGWLLILLNADIVIQADGSPSLPLTSLLAPAPTTITYAFLGAYFFGLNLVHNAYVRGDLRPKTYNLITTRILLVVILAWLIQVASDGTATSNLASYGIAFFAGLVPRTVLHWLSERLPMRIKLDDDNLGNGLGSGDQLRRLDGIDLYERTRLSDEGITTLHALANHDLVDLFFKTRIAASRLLDWVDQAALLLSITEVCGGGPVARSKAIEQLRSVGIRTATDFVDATQRAEERAALGDALVAANPEWGTRDLDGRIDLMRDALRKSEWIGRIEHWRSSRLIAVEAAQRRYIDVRGDLRVGDPRFCAPRPAPPAAGATPNGLPPGFVRGDLAGLTAPPAPVPPPSTPQPDRSRRPIMPADHAGSAGMNRISAPTGR